MKAIHNAITGTTYCISIHKLSIWEPRAWSIAHNRKGLWHYVHLQLRWYFHLSHTKNGIIASLVWSRLIISTLFQQALIWHVTFVVIVVHIIICARHSLNACSTNVRFSPKMTMYWNISRNHASSGLTYSFRHRLYISTVVHNVPLQSDRNSFIWKFTLTVPVCCSSALASAKFQSDMIILILTLIAKFMGPTWAHLGPVGPRWVPCWPHEPCYQGNLPTSGLREIWW